MTLILRGLSALALTSVLGALGACATVTRGTSEQFTIESSPPGAQAHTSSGFNCDSTPCTIRMPRKDGFTVTVSKSGYKTEARDVTTKIAGAGAAGVVGNVLIGGVIGVAVDVTTGAGLDLTPNPLHIDLQADGPSAVPVSAPAAPVASPMAAAAAPSPSPTAASAPAAPAAPPAATAAPAATATPPVQQP